MKPIAWISNLTFKNGFNLPLNPDSIIVFVGPNNSGKSRVLREIVDLPVTADPALLIISHLTLSVNGSTVDFLATIEHRRINNQYYYPHSNNANNTEQVTSYWNALSQGNYSGLRPLAAYFLKHLDTSTRLGLTNPAPAIDLLNSLPSHPIQSIKVDDEKERLFSKYFELAFGEEVIVNHGAGGHIPLHIGIRPETSPEHDRVSRVYLEALRQLPVLHEQGDGMKSFAGLFLTLYADNYSINLIDEPEAFLHPPQATLMGQMVAQILGNEKQLFISTHSEHFLKGLLATASDRLVIVRMQRDGSGSKIKVLDNAVLRNIQGDSLLRYSNILDGLFHKKVVLAESDSDCKFYNAISTTIIEAENLPAQDLLFVQSGGKHRYKIVVKALKSLDVPLIVIGDFDFYHDENPTREVYEELGGNWTDVKSDFHLVRTTISQKRPDLAAADLKAEIDRIFASFSDKVIPDSKIKEIQAALKKSSPWSQAKESGKAYLPGGEPTQAFNRVQDAFKLKKFFVLEVGELEAFDRSVGGHGPKWVNNVLQKDLLHSTDLVLAREFIRRNILT